MFPPTGPNVRNRVFKNKIKIVCFSLLYTSLLISSGSVLSVTLNSHVYIQLAWLLLRLRLRIRSIAKININRVWGREHLRSCSRDFILFCYLIYLSTVAMSSSSASSSAPASTELHCLLHQVRSNPHTSWPLTTT